MFSSARNQRHDLLRRCAAPEPDDARQRLFRFPERGRLSQTRHRHGNTVIAFTHMHFREERCARFATLAAVVLLHSVPAFASPSVHVRSRSTLTLDPVAGAETPTFAGRLTDDQGSPLSDRAVALITRRDHGADSRVIVATDARGSFVHVIADASTRGVLFGSFAGDDDYDASTSSRPIELTRRAIDLRFDPTTARDLDLDQEAAAIAILARTDTKLDVKLLDDARQTLASQTLGPEGRTTFSIGSAKLGEPGPGVLTAVFAGDATHLPAETSLDVVRTRHSLVQLRAAAEGVLSGAVTDRRGKPLSGQTITLTMNGAIEATLITAADGRFELAVPPHWQRGTELVLIARHESNVPWWIGGQSAPLNLLLPHVSQPWWLIVAFTMVSVVASALLGRRQRRDAPVSRKRERAPAPSIELQPATRTAQHHSLRAHVVDAISGQAIANALVVGTSDGQTHLRATTTRDGELITQDLTVATLEIEISAEGYALLQTRIDLPHHGQWHGARIRLLSLRAEALREYRRGLAAAPMRADLINELTPREAQQLHHQQGRPALRPLLERLTRAFEVAYYGWRRPNAETIAELHATADEIEKSHAKSAAESFDAASERSL